MASVAVSFLRATIFSPLLSNRARISPVRERSKASGLTKIRVCGMAFLRLRYRVVLEGGTGSARFRGPAGSRGIAAVDRLRRAGIFVRSDRLAAGRARSALARPFGSV